MLDLLARSKIWIQSSGLMLNLNLILMMRTFFGFAIFMAYEILDWVKFWSETVEEHWDGVVTFQTLESLVNLELSSLYQLI